MTTRPTAPRASCPLTDLAEMKRRGEQIVMVTAYDYPSGRLADAAGIDLVLVGDSAAMTVLGHDSTVPATMEDMIFCRARPRRGARATARRRRHALRLVPGLGRGGGAERRALRQGSRRRRGQARGRRARCCARAAIVGAGIPVMGHIGLTPQSATMLGGFKAQGRSAAQARASSSRKRSRSRLRAASRSCSSAYRPPLPARVTPSSTIPTIGIGAGARLRRAGARLPRHARPLRGSLAALREALRGARDATRTRSSAYADEVREGAFPEERAYLRDARRGARAVRGRRHGVDGASGRAVVWRRARRLSDATAEGLIVLSV